MKAALTEKEIKKLVCPTGKSQVFLWDVSLKGFGLRCTDKGVKSFVVQQQINGVERRRTIGRLGELTLTEACALAGPMLRGMREGVDPTEAKREAKQQRVEQDALAITLDAVAAEYCKHKKTRKRPLSERSKFDIRSHMERNFSDWGPKPVRDITRAMCIKRFDEISTRAPIQANQAFAILKALLNYARDMFEDGKGEYPLLPVNPVKQMQKNLRPPNEEHARETRIPTDHIGAAWNLLRARSDPEHNSASDCTGAHITMFMLLTGTRLGEAQTLTWSQLNLDADVPTFNLPTTKTRPITLPLCTQLRDMLRVRAALPRQRGNDYVFPSRNKGADHFKRADALFKQITKLCGAHVHPHALRRTFLDICPLVGISSDQERILVNHASGDVHARSYANNRDPKVLLPLVQRLADWVVAQGTRTVGANVVELRA